ncbi:MAG: cytidine/deoxycytidylate deaminase family protein [Candidatus Aenigmarchaeota archaeon]|nr:cytidine/deoxycytidylate deaminase family protein [Candidatus Aenigmarchaeota archaeon]
MDRPSWDEYFIEIARTVAKRSTCDRGMSGAVLVKDKRILSTGYVGSPKGLLHCDEAGHLLKKFTDENGNESTHCIRTTHAEQNAIIQAALHGVSTDNATLYCKMEPCLDCAKMIINAGIVRVVCEKKYHKGELTREMFRKAGVELIVLMDETEKYDNQ